jgi:voltage-gated potassium channel Kch
MAILISGDDALTAAVEHALRTDGAVTHLVDKPAFALEREDLAAATVLVLCDDDDGNNVSRALRARKLRPELPMVVRVFDTALVDYLTQTLPGVHILSMSSVTAPFFVEAARKALAEGAASEAKRLARFARRTEARARGFRVDPILVVALASLFLLVFPSALYFSYALNLRYLDALYFVWTTVMTVGYGDIALKDASDGAKLYGMVLMLAGASFIAILFAILSDWVLSRRLDMLHGRTAERGHGHLIVVGAGNIGFRACQRLTSLARRLVVIERDMGSRNATMLAASAHHVIFADATQEETLELAGLHAAALVLALTDSDAVNLQVALAARRHGVPVVMRADTAELAAHVQERGDAIALSPVATATRAFCDAALAAQSGAPQSISAS